MNRVSIFRIATLGLLLAILGTGLAFLALRSSGPSDSLEIILPTPAPPRQAVVYVTGAVGKEGLYTLRESDRVADAVALAGGLAPDADASQVNLAARVADGDHVHVPRTGEERGGPAAPSPAAAININSATAQELDRLPGIGPTRAAAIVAFRESKGRFERIEDLLLVEGIGPATLDRIRPLITAR